MCLKSKKILLSPPLKKRKKKNKICLGWETNGKGIVPLDFLNLIPKGFVLPDSFICGEKL